VIELIAKIGFFLAVAMLIGMGVGWFIADVMRKKVALLELKTLNSTIEERDRQLKVLEDNLSIQKTQLYKLTDEGIVSRHKMLKQANIIQKQSDEIYMIQDKLGQIKSIERDKAECLKSIVELSLQLKEREIKVEEYAKESLLLKNTEDSSNSSSTHEEQILRKEVEELKVLLEESRSTLSDDDMIISKDQFKHIENEFKEFKEKIDTLEKEKKNLILRVDENQKKRGGVVDKFTTVFSRLNKKDKIEIGKQPNLKQV
jgi:chromosome segregation ATPase